jgi:hypothetical protein
MNLATQDVVVVKRKETRKAEHEFGGKPLGSKYLDRAPSGLRIVILSKGSLLVRRF